MNIKQINTDGSQIKLFFDLNVVIAISQTHSIIYLPACIELYILTLMFISYNRYR